MNIVITNSAKRSLKKYYEFYKQTASKSIAKKLKVELIQALESLKTHPVRRSML